MRKLIAFCLCLGMACLAMGGESATEIEPNPAHSACSALPASVVPSTQILQSIFPALSLSAALLTRPEPAAFGTTELEACPQKTTCPALILLDGTCAAGCIASGGAQVTDTGIDECQLGSEVFSCPYGQTIHITTQSCGPCRCCTQTPACICPLNCGAFTALTDWGCQ